MGISQRGGDLAGRSPALLSQNAWVSVRIPPRGNKKTLAVDGVWEF